jgi:hypothetical protein
MNVMGLTLRRPAEADGSALERLASNCDEPQDVQNCTSPSRKCAQYSGRILRTLQGVLQSAGSPSFALTMLY